MITRLEHQTLVSLGKIIRFFVTKDTRKETQPIKFCHDFLNTHTLTILYTKSDNSDQDDDK